LLVADTISYASVLYIAAEGAKMERKLHLYTRLACVDLELMTNTRYTVVVTNSRPGADGTYVLSLITDHLVRLEAIEPEPSPETETQTLAESGTQSTKKGPCCYVSGKPVDFTAQHALTDHGFIFAEHKRTCK
jgi:hypothetical protein